MDHLSIFSVMINQICFLKDKPTTVQSASTLCFYFKRTNVKIPNNAGQYKVKQNHDLEFLLQFSNDYKLFALIFIFKCPEHEILCHFHMLCVKITVQKNMSTARTFETRSETTET